MQPGRQNAFRLGPEETPIRPGGARRPQESHVALPISSGKPHLQYSPNQAPMKKNPITLFLPAFLLGVALLQAGPVMEKQTDGIVLALDGAFLKIEVRADNVIRVAYAKDEAFFARPSLVVLPRSGPVVPWDLTTAPDEATVATAK